jgi:hypothetical protein
VPEQLAHVVADVQVVQVDMHGAHTAELDQVAGDLKVPPGHASTVAQERCLLGRAIR